MSCEACDDDEWKRSVPLTSLAQLTHFPHAVLELKLQLATDGQGPAEPPVWVSELLASGCLTDAPKFSKFVHGTASLYQNANLVDGHPPVRELPYWWSDEVRPMWDDRSKGAKDSQGAMAAPQVMYGGGQEGHVMDPLRRMLEAVLSCGSDELV